MYKKNNHTKQKMVVLGTFILGILISMYAKSLSLNRGYMSIKEKKEIEREIDVTESKVKELKQSKKEYEILLKKFEDASQNDEKSVEELVKEELEQLKKVSGYKQVSGEGISVTIQDSNKELQKGENPNDLIVHDIDILRIVNDLKKSGATAISINGERVLSNTQIKCSGATITVNKTTYGQPFIIKAIGKMDVLKASILSPESYTSLLKDIYGMEVELKEDNNIIIKAIHEN